MTRDLSQRKTAPPPAARYSGLVEGIRELLDAAPFQCPSRQRTDDRNLLGNRSAHRGVRAAGGEAGGLRRRTPKAFGERPHRPPWARLLRPEPGEHAPLLRRQCHKRDFPDTFWEMRGCDYGSVRHRSQFPDAVWDFRDAVATSKYLVCTIPGLTLQPRRSVPRLSAAMVALRSAGSPLQSSSTAAYAASSSST